jgi:hypothetical protein
MTTKAVSLDAVLHGLAEQFARQVVAELLRVRVRDLRPMLEDTVAPAPVARRAKPRASRRTLPAAGAPARPSRSQVGRPRVSESTREVLDDDLSPSNAITNPDLLLDAADGVKAPLPRRDVARPAPPRTPPSEVRAEASPVLREGERLQRTAGGNVVLRRGRR